MPGPTRILSPSATTIRASWIVAYWQVGGPLGQTVTVRAAAPTAPPGTSATADAMASAARPLERRGIGRILFPPPLLASGFRGRLAQDCPARGVRCQCAARDPARSEG